MQDGFSTILVASVSVLISMILVIVHRKFSLALRYPQLNLIKNIYKHSSVGCLCLEINGQVVYANPSSSRLLDLKSTSLKDSHETLFNARNKKQMLRVLQEISSLPTSECQIEITQDYKTKPIKLIKVVAHPLLNNKEQITHLFLALTDITTDKMTALAKEKIENEYRFLFERLGIGVAKVFKGKLLSCNEHFSKLLRGSASQLKGQPIKHYVDHNVKVERNTLIPVVSFESVVEFEANVRSVDKKERWCHIRVSQATKDLAIWTIADASHVKESSEHLRQAATVFESANDSILVLDTALVIKMANPAFLRLTHFQESEIKGKKIHFLGGMKHKLPFYQEIQKQLDDSGLWQGEMWHRRRDNQVFPVWMSLNAINGLKGNVEGYVAISTDMTVRKKNEEKIIYQANYDALTGLPNRFYFMQNLKKSMQKAWREGVMLAFIYIDLDRFKHINDSLGHAMGDLLLKKVAKIINACLRESDWVSRFGGDEFAIMLFPIYGAKNASTVAKTILDYLARPIDLNGYDVVVGGSVGISLYPNDGKDAEALLKSADLATFKAKELGRNNYQFFTDSLQESARERVALEQELRKALLNNELFLNFQPQYSFAERKTFGVEVLVRWDSPTRGIVSPAKFVPIAEETGMILEIGEWVLRHACRQYRQWQLEHIAPEHMAINVSGRQFLANNFVSAVLTVLEDEQVSAEFIELELTESILMDDQELAIAILAELRSLGFNLSIDDFGTGYSSLSYLKRFPIDTLKVDQSFVKDTPDNAENTAIVKAVID
ncbi:MAG: EAL domain-containing protein, partial [Pseudomonadota bacterium]